MAVFGIDDAIVGGALGLGGAIFGGVSAAQAQRETNQMNYQMFKEGTARNMAEAQKNREFQEYMAGSSHQREVEDMKKAGLNPILSAGGGGAATPGGSSASAASAPTLTSPGGKGAEVGLSTAFDAARLARELKATGSQARLNEAAADVKEKEKELVAHNTRTAAAAADAAEIRARATPDLVDAEIKSKRAQNWWSQRFDALYRGTARMLERGYSPSESPYKPNRGDPWESPDLGPFNYAPGVGGREIP